MAVIVAATTAIIRQIVLFSRHHPGLEPLDSAAYTWPLVYRCNISSLHYPSSVLKPEVITDTYLTLCMMGNFTCFCCRLLTFFKINFLIKFFQEHYQSVNQFGSRSGLKFCQSWSGSKLFAKVISRPQKLEYS